MGWSDCGKDSKGRPIGYGYNAQCDRPGCNTKIDRGLSYVCGLMHGNYTADGGYFCCESYFCARHLFFPDSQIDLEIDEEEDYELVEDELQEWLEDNNQYRSLICEECCKELAKYYKEEMEK